MPISDKLKTILIKKNPKAIQFAAVLKASWHLPI
jgi:hypothetical protein